MSRCKAASLSPSRRILLVKGRPGLRSHQCRCYAHPREATADSPRPLAPRDSPTSTRWFCWPSSETRELLPVANRLHVPGGSGQSVTVGKRTLRATLWRASSFLNPLRNARSPRESRLLGLSDVSEAPRSAVFTSEDDHRSGTKLRTAAIDLTYL